MFDRLKRMLNADPDLTWIESAALPTEVEPEPIGRAWPWVKVNVPFTANLPIVFGGIIVLGLFLIVLFGPAWAPENPYLAGQRSSMVIDGTFTTSPFPPMPGLPLGTDQWGRDILSLLLYGTRNTLVACLFIAMARILLGLSLGLLAGWNEGRSIDRVVMSLVEASSALPALLTGMILIMALGIQKGIAVFIVALCFVGWAEIAQYMRSETLVVKRKPFIDSARVVGLDDLGITVRHILPNVLPALVVIAVLEMAAVLMILGELGFIGVFIGGGTWVQVGDTTVANIPDIPEWGAMMAGSRAYARSKTWMVFYPSAAFFVAVLGFNLLGEGLRRIVQSRGVSTAFILSRRAILVVAGITAATAYIITHVGPAPSYAGLAQRFDASGALTHISELTEPQLAARLAGTQGGQLAAEYIAQRFLEYGLEPINPHLDIYLPMATQRVLLAEPPLLDVIESPGTPIQPFVYPIDFGIDVRNHGGSGQVVAPVVLVRFRGDVGDPRHFRGLDLRERVVLYWESDAPPDFATEALLRGARALLVVSADYRSRLQLALPTEDYLRPVTLPTLRISPRAANALLLAAGLSPEQAEHRDWDEPDVWQATELNLHLRISVQLSVPEQALAASVVGLLRGTDATLNKEMVIVSTHYDGGGRQPDGALWQQASQGTSGVSIMLEILRLWRTSGFQPRRTILFAAWVGGDWEYSGAHEYASSYAGYSVARTVAVINLGNLGYGTDNLSATGDSRLTDLLVRSAQSTGLTVSEGPLPQHAYYHAIPAPALTVGWNNPDLHPAEDTVDLVSSARLSEAGHLINLMLITLSREYDY